MNKQLISLIVILISACAAAYFLYVKSVEQAPEKALLYPKLLENADKIDRVQITRADGVVIDARRTRDGWRAQLQQPQISYPINQQALTDLAESLTKAILFEAKTTKSENFARLGLTDVTQTDSQATLVEVGAAGESYQVLVGIVAKSGQGSYVRKADTSQTWLLDRIIDLPTDMVDWLRQPIVDFSAQQVNGINRTDDSTFSIIRQQNEQGGFSLLNIPQGQTLKYDSIIDSYVDNIVSLNFDAIEVAEEGDWDASDLSATFELSLQNGQLVNLSILEKAEQHFVKFESVDENSNKYWNAQTYKISNFSHGQINKVLEDFIESPATDVDEVPVASIDEGEAPSGE